MTDNKETQMENEEKEIKTEAETPKETVEAEVVTSEEESDFADQVKPEVVPEKPEEKPVEEEPEEQINLFAEKEEVVPETEEQKVEEAKETAKETSGEYVYESPELAATEEARKNFHKIYKKLNIIKWVITAIGLALIACGWIIPTAIGGINSNITMYISLGVTAVVLVGISVYSMIFRKKVNAQMKVYFKEFYEHNNAYVYPKTVENLTGTVDDKLPEETFLNSGIYENVAKVGSRAYMTFTYKGFNGSIADAAAQKKGERQLETLFVGKFLYFDGITSNDDLLIYLKGNKRALPPNSLKGRQLIEDSKTMVVYGNGKAKSLLTKKVRDALSKFDTNKTFIDLAIAINQKGLFFAVGYEDDLMVLPLEKPFNPAPTKQNKGDIEKILNFVDAITTRHDDR